MFPFQRLCEEMEYSELLDKAADYDDPYERMVSFTLYNFVFVKLYFMWCSVCDIDNILEFNVTSP